MDATHRLPSDDHRAATPVPVADRVADTMRRVHAELRGGGTPSFEALLALGEPRLR